MTDKQIIDNILSGVFGGELHEFMYNNYMIKMRIHDDKISINFLKDKKRICHIYKENFIDAFGKLSAYIENNESEAKELLNNIWNVIINEN